MSDEIRLPEPDEAATAESAMESAMTDPAGTSSAVSEESVGEPHAEPAFAAVPEPEIAADGNLAEGGSAEAVAEEAGSDAEFGDGDGDDASGDGEEAVLVVGPRGPIEELSEAELAEDIRLEWYIVKVQSNRERTSSEALKRKVAIEGLDRFFGEIIVPTEKVTEFKNGKKKTVERKIWPGYIAVQMHVNDDTWFAMRETSGIGDFTGASGKPIPMTPSDIEKILPKEEGPESEEATPKLNIKFAERDKVKVTDGNFENFEGEVDAIDQQSGKVTVMISIFGRSTPVELEYWQVEKT